jgi:thymidylate kinase
VIEEPEKSDMIPALDETILKTKDLKGRSETQCLQRKRLHIIIFGPDGSGKSTQARLLAAYLMTCGFKVRIVWIKSFHTLAYLLSRLYQKLSPRSVELNAYGHIIRIKPLCHGKLRRSLWAWIEFFSIIPKNFIEVYIPSLIGETIITERYLIDSIVSIAYAIDDNRFDLSLIARLLLHLIPKNSIFIHLDSDYETIKKRRQNLTDSVDFLRFQRRMYFRLSVRLGATKINTCEQNIEETNREIRKLFLV